MVENIKTKKQYAAKTSLRPLQIDEEETIVLNEVNTLINMNNPAILKIIGYSLFDLSKKPYLTIILEYMPNGT